MKSKVKTAISLSLEYFKKIEEIRKQVHKSRSQIITEALQSWLKNQEINKLERQYIEGYEKIPESQIELESLFKAGLTSFGEEKW